MEEVRVDFRYVICDCDSIPFSLGVLVPIAFSFNPVNHIENRRLADAAYGHAKLEAWERVHVHECHVCQGVFYLFVIQEQGIKSSDEESD